MKRSRFSTFPLLESEVRHIEFGTKNSSSGLLGVHQTPKGDWNAQCKFKSKNISLGSYPDKITAALRRDGEMLKLFGDEAVTNLRLGLLGDYMRETKLSDLQLYWKNKFLDFLKSSTKPISMGEFTQKESKAARLDVSSLEKIIFWLEAQQIIQIDRRNARPMQFKCSLRQQEENASHPTPQTDKETQMKEVKEITTKSPKNLKQWQNSCLSFHRQEKKRLRMATTFAKFSTPLFLRSAKRKANITACWNNSLMS